MLKRPPTGALGPLNEEIVDQAVRARIEDSKRTEDPRAAPLPRQSLIDFTRSVVHACTEGNEPCDDMIVEGNVRALRQRSRAGVAKYGRTLDRDDLTTTDWLEHLRQELLDGANYAERLLCNLSTLENEWRGHERGRIVRLIYRRLEYTQIGDQTAISVLKEVIREISASSSDCDPPSASSVASVVNSPAEGGEV